MKDVIQADFNATTPDDGIWLNTPWSLPGIQERCLKVGDWVWLSDGEIQVGAQLVQDERFGWVGRPAWETTSDLVVSETDDFHKILRELRDLLKRVSRSRDENARIYELLALADIMAPPGFLSGIQPGLIAYRQAVTLMDLGREELALKHAIEARQQAPGDGNIAFLFLELLRRIDLRLAVVEANAIMNTGVASAAAIAGCLNVLSDDLDHEGMDSDFRRSREVLEWAKAFDQAADRAGIQASLLALVRFNEGLASLRLGELEKARVCFAEAGRANPRAAAIQEASGLGAYGDEARRIAQRVRAGAILDTTAA